MDNSLSSSSRLLLFAPHPDDETLACSITLQRAVSAGASVCVVYATNGEDNVWPQRFLFRKWNITQAHKETWAAVRQTEARRALNTLGIADDSVRFLGLPDQQLTKLLLCKPGQVLAELTRCIDENAPTHLLIPALCDTHPDHSALGVLLELALEEGIAEKVVIWKYVVHIRGRRPVQGGELLGYRAGEKEKKRDAIACHGTQLALSSRRFFSYADQPEALLPLPEPFMSGGSIVRAVRQPVASGVELRIARTRRVSNRGRLLLVGRDTMGVIRSFQFDWPSATTLGNPGDALVVQAEHDSTRLLLKLNSIRPDCAIFLKLERPVILFDEAGWLRMPGASKETCSHRNAVASWRA